MINDWILLQSPGMIYALLFLLLFGGGLGLPIPEDFPLLLAGIAVHRNSISIEWAIFLCYMGVLLGDIMVFSFGKKLGPSLFEMEWFKSKVSRRKVRQIQLRLQKHGFLMILVARHLFYLRSMTFLTCGAVNMPFKRFLIFDMLSGLISVPLMIGLGYIFAEQYDKVVNVKHQVEFWFFVGLLIIAICLTCYLLYRKFTKSKDCGCNDQTNKEPN